MRRIFSLFLIIVSSHCFSQGQPDCNSLSQKYRLIKMQPYEKYPSFYVRNNNYVIYFDEQKIRSYFSRRKSSSLSEKFKSRILSHFPLIENTDLYIDSISGKVMQERNYEFMIADLLEMGDAAVLPAKDIWAEEEKASYEIKLYTLKSSISGFRYFCSQNNEMIFSIMDYIS